MFQISIRIIFDDKISQIWHRHRRASITVTLIINHQFDLETYRLHRHISFFHRPNHIIWPPKTLRNETGSSTLLKNWSKLLKSINQSKRKWSISLLFMTQLRCWIMYKWRRWHAWKGQLHVLFWPCPCPRGTTLRVLIRALTNFVRPPIRLVMRHLILLCLEPSKNKKREENQINLSFISSPHWTYVNDNDRLS